jgi:hypothetical protein
MMIRLAMRQVRLAKEDAKTELSGFGPDRIVARNSGPSWFVVGSLALATMLVALSWLPSLIA